MKNAIFFLFAFQLFSQEYCCEERSFWDFHPWHVGANAIALTKANVERKHGGHDGDVLFNKANAFTYFMLPISECSFFMPRVEWNTFTLDWNRNPRFNATHFHYMQFALSFFSAAVDTWKWIARIDYNIDIKHFNHPKSYGLFSALLWGIHEINCQWHYHIGALGYTGFHGQEVYPVIGLDYSPNKSWFFQAVFPITYSIEYIFNERWRLGLKGRPLKERFKVGKLEPSPRSIFSYSTFGGELNLHYERFLRLDLEFFAGYNFGGDMYFKDKHNHNALYTNVEGSFYGGASLNWGI